MKYKILLFTVLLSLGLFSCTKLDETLRADLPKDQAEALIKNSTDVKVLLQAVYDGLQGPYQDQSQVWAASEHTTDEAIGPTRGPDWDDNGVWRVLHSHSWDADHAFLTNTFNALLQVVFSSTNVLNFNPSPTQAAEARFLRAFVMFSVLDGWDQVPYRDPGESLLKAPKVLKGSAALDFIISEVKAILNDLPDGPAYKANKDAARVFLMKCYLNKGAIANRAAPTFDAADMNQVITLADQIINSGKYSLSNNIYDNFAPNNDQISTENIFTNQNIGGVKGGNVQSRWYCGLHYNQKPSGWNGFTTLADFYDKFEASDTRRQATYQGVTNVSGLNVGFLIGQQYDQNGKALQDRKGNPLAFTRDVKLVETGNNLEVTGIRVMKYPPDYVKSFPAENDYVFYRYSDVLLMKAEALLRTGNAAGALTIVNTIRLKRGASPLVSIDLNSLLDERGRELYWEGWRRQDLIRFGKFLQPWAEKPQDNPKYLLFPIPNTALAVNPNLKQNPGY